MNRLLLLLPKGRRTLEITRMTRGQPELLFKLKPTEVDRLIELLAQYRARMVE